MSTNKSRIKIKFLLFIKSKRKQKIYKTNSKKDILIDKIHFQLGNLDIKNIIKTKIILIQMIKMKILIIKKLLTMIKIFI